MRLQRSWMWMICMLPAACSVPDMAAPDAASAGAELQARVQSSAAVSAALALLPREALDVPLPDLPADSDPATLDADAPEWWLATACAFNPAVREARLALQAALGRLAGMGSPMALGLEAEAMDPDNAGPEMQLKIMVDLFGLLGIGRSSAEKALGHAEVRAARNRLAQALWEAQFAAQRARIELAAQRLLKADLDTLVTAAEADQARILQLQMHGRLAESSVATARAQWHRALEARSKAANAVANAQATLAIVCGLPADAAPLARIGAATIDDFDVAGGVPALPAFDAVISARPDIQGMALEFAMREAELRLAASQAIPLLVPGYMPLFAEGMKPQPGTMLRMDMNWPTAVQAGIDAALARRESAAAAYVDAANAAWARLRAKREEMLRAWEDLQVHAPIVDQSTTTAWNAARRAFSLDPAMLADWTMQLEKRVMALEMVAEHRIHGLTTILEYLEALGVRRATGAGSSSAANRGTDADERGGADQPAASVTQQDNGASSSGADRQEAKS